MSVYSTQLKACSSLHFLKKIPIFHFSASSRTLTIFLSLFSSSYLLSCLSLLKDYHTPRLEASYICACSFFYSRSVYIKDFQRQFHLSFHLKHLIEDNSHTHAGFWRDSRLHKLSKCNHLDVISKLLFLKFMFESLAIAFFFFFPSAISAYWLFCWKNSPFFEA